MNPYQNMSYSLCYHCRIGSYGRTRALEVLGGDLVFVMLAYHTGKICHLISLDFSHLLCTPL